MSSKNFCRDVYIAHCLLQIPKMVCGRLGDKNDLVISDYLNIIILWHFTRCSTISKRKTMFSIEIHISISPTGKAIIFYLRIQPSLCSQIYARFIILFTKHNYIISESFIKETQRYKWLKTAKSISVFLLVLGPLLTVTSAIVNIWG